MNFFVLKSGHLQIIIIALKIASFVETKNVHSAMKTYAERNSWFSREILKHFDTWTLSTEIRQESVLLKLFQLWLKFSVAKFMYKLKFILITF